MKILKHFIKVAKAYAVRIGCKHQESYSASCPYTGMTYTSCNRCLARLKVQKTNG